MKTFWDYINSVGYTKKYIWGRDPENDKLYDVFLANRHFSNFPDSIMYAQELNLCGRIPAKWNYDYFINSLRPNKRFAGKSKKTVNNDIKAISEYYGYNRSKSEVALSLLSPEQIEVIKRKLEKGGRK